MARSRAALLNCCTLRVDTDSLVSIVVFYAVCWLGCFVVGLWLDEDVNHWDWPTDDGPGARVTARIAGVSALVALVPLAVMFGVGGLAKYLGSL